MRYLALLQALAVALLMPVQASEHEVKAKVSCRFAYACLVQEKAEVGDYPGTCPGCGGAIVARTRTLAGSYARCENGHVFPLEDAVKKDPYTKAIETVLETKQDVTVFFYDSSLPECPLPRGCFACDLKGRSENFKNYWIDKGDKYPVKRVIAYHDGKAVRLDLIK